MFYIELRIPNEHGSLSITPIDDAETLAEAIAKIENDQHLPKKQKLHGRTEEGKYFLFQLVETYPENI